MDLVPSEAKSKVFQSSKAPEISITPQPLPQRPMRVPSGGGRPKEINVPTVALYTNFVFVIVGSKEKIFGVHRGLLSQHSSFFDAAFNGSFREASENSVALAEESEATFVLFLAWLYTQTLNSVRDGKDSPCSIKELIQLHVFGDKLGIPNLKNLAMDTLIEHLIGRNSTEIVQKIFSYTAEIYENSPENSPLRRLLVDFMISECHMPDEILSNPHLTSWSPDLLRDLVVASAPDTKAKTRDRVPSFAVYTCKYHDHGDGDACETRPEHKYSDLFCIRPDGLYPLEAGTVVPRLKGRWASSVLACDGNDDEDNFEDSDGGANQAQG